MESSLTLTWQDYRAAVGFFLGWGRGSYFGSQAWSTDQEAEIEFCVKSGHRRFYYPSGENGEIYDWTFLTPGVVLTLASGGSSIAMPDDFGGIDGPITVTSASNTGSVWWGITTTHIGTINQLYAGFPTMTGRPTHAAEQSFKNTTVNSGQRFLLKVFPLADQDYFFQIQYSILPAALSGAVPISLGGSAHCETILEACLSVAEERLDDAKSVHADAFARRLKASMYQDRRRKPQTLGYNGDRSDCFGDTRYKALLPITVNDVQY